MYVVYVSYGCCKSRSGVAYVAITIHVYCKYMFLNVSDVLNVCCKCFIWCWRTSGVLCDKRVLDNALTEI